MRDAQAAQAKGDHDLALRLAQSAIVAAPSRPAAYTALGDLYAAHGDADFARFYYRQALQIDPADARRDPGDGGAGPRRNPAGSEGRTQHAMIKLMVLLAL